MGYMLHTLARVVEAGGNTIVFTSNSSKPAIHFNSILRPSVRPLFVPSLLGATVLSSSVLSPSVLGLSVLGPSILVPSVLGPSVFGSSVLHPSDLFLFVLCPSVHP